MDIMIGDVIPINIIFSEAVTVNTSAGVPQITLETGNTDMNVVMYPRKWL